MLSAAWVVVVMMVGEPAKETPDAGAEVKVVSAAEDKEVLEKLELLQNMPAIEELDLMRELTERPDGGSGR